MLLGNKKNQENDQNWCLVLNTLQSEIDKKKVAGKISEVFSLSQDEAVDLVSNTPIILLDNLARPVAVKAKDYFRSTGAEMFLTNDIFLKRKCYRTVWPDPPSLSFLKHVADLPQQDEKQERLAPAQAVQEMRSLGLRDAKQERLPVSSGDKKGDLSAPDKTHSQEVNRLKDELESLRKKFTAQSQELEKARTDFASRERGASSSDALVKDRDKEIQKFRAILASVEEKYEGLKEEYRQARTLFEEKFAALNKENQEWKKKSDQLAQEKEKVEEIRKNLEQEMTQRTKKFEGVDEEFRQVRTHLDAKFKQASEEIEAWKSKSEEMNKKIHALDQERVQLEQKLDQQVKENENWRGKYQEAANQLLSLESGRDNDKSHFEKEKQKWNQAEKLRVSLEFSLNEEREKAKQLQQQLATALQEIEEWKTQADEMAGKLWGLEQNEKNLSQLVSDKEAALKREMAVQQKELEAALAQGLQEINDWKARFQGLAARCQELETQAGQAALENQKNKESYAEMEAVLNQKNQDAEELREFVEELKTRYNALEMAHKQEKSVRAKAEERQKELEQSKLVLEQKWNEVQRGYDILQEQYRKEKMLMESQSAKTAQEIEDWKTRCQDRGIQVQSLEQEKAVFTQKMEDQAREIRLWQDKHNAGAESLKALQTAFEAEKSQREQILAEFQILQQNKQSLEKWLRDEQLKNSVLDKESREAKVSFEQRIAALHQEVESWKIKVEEIKGKNQAFEKNQLQLIQELDDRSKKIQQGEMKALELEKALQELNASYQSLEKMFQANLKHMESKEKELENNRRQVRDLNQQLEQRELIYKRMQLTNQLIEKETSLKKLVREQEKIEVEIREREENLRKVLSEQEAVEKEIIEGKQAQRHYQEQAKKDKAPRLKTNRADEEDLDETEFSSREPHSAVGND